LPTFLAERRILQSYPARRWVPSGVKENGMVAEARKVGEKRYRETYGRCFEDFTVGDVYEHRPGRTITEADNTWFTLLTMNTGTRCTSIASTRATPSSASRSSTAR
jgi:hypothetical protein